MKGELIQQTRRLILVTGATGFIGARLARAVAEKGYRVRCMVRSRDAHVPEETEKITGDVLQPLSLPAALHGIDTAFYLIHALSAMAPGFERRDRQGAENFRSAAEDAGVRRIIYLGGLGETNIALSPHLASRMEVARILRAGNYHTTILRAAIIIGAGGASFELIRTLVKKLPIIVAPRWVSTRCQPIAVQDVIAYLTGCLENETTAGGSFDIGGPEILTYQQMMERMAAIDGRTATVIPVPFIAPRVSAFLAAMLTPGNPSISMALIEGLKTEVICREQRIRQIIPLSLASYDDAVRLALAEENQKL